MALNNPYALSFDGVDDHALGPQLSTHNTGTVECVIQVLHEHIGAFVGTYSTTTGGNNRQLALAVYPYTQDRFRIHISAVSTHDALLFTAVTASGFTYGEPHHVAYTSQHGSGKVALIVDGIIQDMTTELGTMTDCFFGRVMQPSDRLQIGAKRDIYGVHSRPFRGIVDEFRLWNYVRTLEQIQTNAHRRLTGSETGLVVYYRFDEGAGDVAYDSSPNGYHGEITGATWVPGLVDLEEEGQGKIITGSITFRGRSSMSLAGVKRATGSITFRGQSSMFLSAVKTAVGKITFRGGSFMSLIGLVLRELEGVYQISSSEIISRNQPVLSTDLANYIEVWINPRVPADQAEEVYRSKEPEPIPPGGSKTFSLKLDKEPVIEAVASLEDAGANLAITDTKFYSGSAEITVTNTGATEQTCIIVVQARPLELQGRRKIVVKDEESILDHGLVKYTFDSPLVQDEESAYDIGRKILWLFSVARANIEIEWRGDPALELADPVQIPEFEKLGVSKKENFYVVRQLLEVVEGGLDATLSGRKIPRLKEGD